MLHIHVGYDSPEIDRSLRMLHYMDAFLGIPSIIIDTDTQRRTLYGKAGCFRLVPYGVEYRTLSSYFLKDDDHLSWVYNQTIKAVNAYNSCKIIPDPDIVQKVINENKVEDAKWLCEKYNLCDNFLDK